MSELKVGIIGCGRMAGTIDDEVQDYAGIIFPYGHAGAYRVVPGVRLTAASDIDPERLQTFSDRFGIPQRFTDYREMLAEVQPDIVSITTRATARAGIILDAVKAGVRAIYAEKALACSMAEVDAITAACRQAGVAFNIGTSRRYHPGYRHVRELIAEGAIGEVRTSISYSRGHLMHTHSHTIDTLLSLLGDPAVQGVHGKLGGVPAEIPNGRFESDPLLEWAHIECEGGLAAHMLNAPSRYEFEVSGTEGAVLIYNNGFNWHLRQPGELSQKKNRVWEMRAVPDFDRSISSTRRAVQELVDALETGAPTSGNLDIAVASMEVGVGIAESHLKGSTRVAVPASRNLYISSR